MKPARRKPLLKRFATIIILTLILPVIILTVLLDWRTQRVYQSRVEETLQACKFSFLSRLSMESQDIAQRAAAIMANQELLEMFRAKARHSSRYDMSLDVLGRQVDFTITWLDGLSDYQFTIGRSSLDPASIRAIAKELAQGASASRIMVDADGLFLVQVNVDGSGSGIRGYLVIQRRISRADLDALRLALGQDLTVVESATGKVIFSTVANVAEYQAGLSSIYTRAKLTLADSVFSDTISGGKTLSCLWFHIPEVSGIVLDGIISVPDKPILPADITWSFLTISIGVILLVLLSSILLTKAVIAPILSLSYAVESMRLHLNQHGPLVSIPVKENDEVGDLAKVINGLGQDLRHSVEKIEQQRAEIVAYTHSLEERVQERTQQLEEARMRAEIANQHKSKFLVNMNHELRTPLNSISGITDLLRYGAYEKHEEMATKFGVMWGAMVGMEGVPTDLLVLLEDLATGLVGETSTMRLVLRYIKERLTDAQIVPAAEISDLLTEVQTLVDDEERQVFRAYNNIRDAGESLLGIIDEVINLSRIESGVITIMPQKVNISELVVNCMTHAESYARTKRKLINLTFSRQIEDSVPPFLLLDGQKVKQVLLNLLTNAVKYTEHGYVHCRLGLVTVDGKNFLHCSVQDSGRGIAEKDRELLFMEFGRAFEVREIEGSGLGLALSRKLIERHGGSMGFNSHEGDGSTFWFTLPLVLPPES